MGSLRFRFKRRTFDCVRCLKEKANRVTTQDNNENFHCASCSLWQNNCESQPSMGRGSARFQ